MPETPPLPFFSFSRIYNTRAHGVLFPRSHATPSPFTLRQETYDDLLDQNDGQALSDKGIRMVPLPRVTRTPGRNGRRGRRTWDTSGGVAGSANGGSGLVIPPIS